ncbi:MAG TPA: hypothetical protein VJH94_02675, partial [Candidatus Paceibacterota bacterium]
MKNGAPLVSYASDLEQKRLTLAGRFVTEARYLSDEQIATLLQNQNQDQIPELMTLVARLGRDQRIAVMSTAEAGPRITIPGTLAKEWEVFWKTEY